MNEMTLPPDTGFEIRALAVSGRARYLSVTEAPHNIEFHTWMGKKHLKKHFVFLQTAETRNRTPNSSVKGGGANHYPRAPPDRRIQFITGRQTVQNECYFPRTSKIFAIDQYSMINIFGR